MFLEASKVIRSLKNSGNYFSSYKLLCVSFITKKLMETFFRFLRFTSKRRLFAGPGEVLDETFFDGRFGCRTRGLSFAFCLFVRVRLNDGSERGCLREIPQLRSREKASKYSFKIELIRESTLYREGTTSGKSAVFPEF